MVDFNFAVVDETRPIVTLLYRHSKRLSIMKKHSILFSIILFGFSLGLAIYGLATPVLLVLLVLWIMLLKPVIQFPGSLGSRAMIEELLMLPIPERAFTHALVLVFLRTLSVLVPGIMALIGWWLFSLESKPHEILLTFVVWLNGILLMWNLVVLLHRRSVVIAGIVFIGIAAMVRIAWNISTGFTGGEIVSLEVSSLVILSISSTLLYIYLRTTFLNWVRQYVRHYNRNWTWL